MAIHDTFIRRWTCDSPGCVAHGTGDDGPHRDFVCVTVDANEHELVSGMPLVRRAVLCAQHAEAFLGALEQHGFGEGPR